MTNKTARELRDLLLALTAFAFVVAKLWGR